jgi:hypothetical protein
MDVLKTPLSIFSSAILLKSSMLALRCNASLTYVKLSVNLVNTSLRKSSSL